MESNYRVRLSALAQGDFEAIIDWHAEHDSSAGHRLVDELQRRFHDRLSQTPHSAPVRLIRSGHDIRRLTIKTYCVYFTIDEAEKSVSVLRVLHGARNAGDLL